MRTVAPAEAVAGRAGRWRAQNARPTTSFCVRGHAQKRKPARADVLEGNRQSVGTGSGSASVSWSAIRLTCQLRAPKPRRVSATVREEISSGGDQARRRMKWRALTLTEDADVVLDAQAYLEAWYEQFGFVRCGEPYLEDGIEHVSMLKRAAPRP